MTTPKKQLIFPVILGLILIYFGAVKLIGLPEPIALFTALGQEPVGRILVGALELLAGILLIIPRSTALGAGLTIGLMGGAIMAHLTKLGFEGANGVMAVLAVIILIASFVLFYQRRATHKLSAALFAIIGK